MQIGYYISVLNCTGEVKIEAVRGKTKKAQMESKKIKKKGKQKKRG